MIAEASLITVTKAKIISGCALAVLTLAADTQVSPASVEDYTLKSVLVVTVIFLGKLLLKQQQEHKTEMKELRDKHEDAMKTVVTANTASNEKVAELAEEQANYFKTVTRSVMDEKLHGHAPNLP